MPKALIVDDSPIVTKMLDASLSRHGFEVSVSNSPFGVSNMIREFQPHVLLMDLGLPGLSGEKLLNMCQEIGFKCYTVIVSSAPEAELKAHVRKGLADDYFIKGTPIEILVEKLLRNAKPDPVEPSAPVKPAPIVSAPARPATSAVVWRKDLEIGVEEIDSQHREIFKRFNDLLEACSDGKGRVEVCNYLSFLHEYVGSHFDAEERLQAKHAYPDYEQHRQQHQHFTADLDRLQEFMKEDGAGLALVMETNKITISWLLKHISNSDKAFGEFLRGKI